MTAYRVAPYFEKCMDSILAQTFEDFEIILVDDGSDDRTGEICDRYAAMDSRVRVIHKENGGHTSARNAGVEIARGRYITFVDGDDWLDANAYQEVFKKVYETQADMVCFGLLKEYPGFSEKYLPALKAGVYTVDSLRKSLEKFLNSSSLGQMPICLHLSAEVVRKELFQKTEKEIENKEIQIGEDNLRLSLMLLSAAKTLVISFAPYHYRIREGSMIRTMRRDDRNGCTYLIKELTCLLRRMKTYGAMERKYVLREAYYFLAFMSTGDFLRGDSLQHFPQVQRGSNVLIYGKGRFGQGIARYVRETGFCNLLGLIDRNDIEKLAEMGTYDGVLIGIVNHDAVEDARERLLARGVPREKIWCVDQSTLTEELLPKEIRECLG